jgi:hypothetical protein
MFARGILYVSAISKQEYFFKRENAYVSIEILNVDRPKATLRRMYILSFLLIVVELATIAVGQTSQCDYKWINQPIDHFGGNNETFL